MNVIYYSTSCILSWRTIRLSVLVTAASLVASCASVPLDSVSEVAAESISEVSLSSNSGLGRTQINVILRKDGNARCECVFFWLHDEPQADPKTICGQLFQRNPTAFTKKPEPYVEDRFSLEGVFEGKVSPEQFARLAKLVVASGYFSMKDEYIELVLDAPPTGIVVAHSGGVKEVRFTDRLRMREKYPELMKKLSEIEAAIWEAAGEAAWEKGGN